MTHHTNRDSVLIYDGDCAYCSAASKALERLDDVEVAAWQDDEAQEFLRAQFGQAPFSMFLVDFSEGRIYAGESAAEELAERAGVPSLASDLVRESYDGIASLVGIASGRDRETDDYHDVYELSDDASELRDELVDAAGSMSIEVE